MTLFRDPTFLTWFLGITAVMYWVGMTALAGRRRVRHIQDMYEPGMRKTPGKLRRSLAGLLPVSESGMDRLEQELKRAGYYASFAAIEFLATRNTIVVGLALIGGTAAVLSDPTTSVPELIMIATVVFAALAYLVPRLILKIQSRARLGRIETGLPDALDMVRMCLTGGLPLRGALERVAQEVEFFHPDLAVELEVVRRHAEADTMPKALREFSRRLNTPDVNALATLVSQTERLGTHVAVAVTEFADSVRRQQRQRAEERASKTSIRMLFPVIFCLAPPVFILLLGPPVLQLKNFLKDAHGVDGVLNPETYSELPTNDSSPEN
ncbi:type II secretion system F family protein [Thalassoroseus pseudoceratinae]|uniref:type II secretion system F family protein n=1 Tax=Thalassoroseus pseudoceratinae TaxID=2713176 RepID=UPI0014211872|nr:type II secretion system F family protein [Thalassoroseus pseudoceratinae]